MIGLGLGGGFGGGEQAATVVSLLGGDQYLSWLDRISRGWQSVDDAQQRASRSGATLQKIGLGLTGVTGSVLALGVAATRMGNDVYESEDLVSTVFKKGTDDIKKWSEERRRALGMNSYEQRRSAAGFQTKFDAAELDPATAREYSKAFVEMRDDLVSLYNVKDPNETFTALQAGLSGETEPLRRYSIFLSEANIKQYALANGIGKANGELSEQEKIVARAGFILESFNKSAAKGNAEATKDSPTNKLRRMKNERDQAMAELGMSLVPIENDLIRIANAVIPPIKAGVEWFSKLNDSTKRWIVILGGATGPLLWIIGKVKTLVDLKNTLSRNPAGGTGNPGLPGGLNPAIRTAVMNVRAGVVNINGGLGQGGGSSLADTGSSGRNNRRGRSGRRGRRGLPGARVSRAGRAAGTAADSGRTAAGAAAAALGAGNRLAGNRSVLPVLKEAFRPTSAALRGLSLGQRLQGGIQLLSRGTVLQGIVARLTTGSSATRFKDMAAARQISGAVAGAKYGNAWTMAGKAAPWLTRGAAAAGGVLAGYDAAQDYKRIGMNKDRANAIGVAIGASATAVLLAALTPAAVAAAPALAIAAPFVMAAGAARWGANRFYNEPMERKAERGSGLSDEQIAGLAGKDSRAKADEYFALRDRLLKQEDFAGAELALMEAHSHLRRAKKTEKAAAAAQKQREFEAWAIQARAEQEALNNPQTSAGMSPAAAKLAQHFGMVPEGNLTDNRKVKVKTMRDNQDQVHLSATIPAGRGDVLARNLRFGLTTPAPAL